MRGSLTSSNYLLFVREEDSGFFKIIHVQLDYLLSVCPLCQNTRLYAKVHCAWFHDLAAHYSWAASLVEHDSYADTYKGVIFLSHGDARTTIATYLTYQIPGPTNVFLFRVIHWIVQNKIIITLLFRSESTIVFRCSTSSFYKTLICCFFLLRNFW